MNRLRLEVAAAINADKFRATVTNDADDVLFDREYHCGYDYTYNPAYARPDKPLGSVVIDRIVAGYDIREAKVVAGHNTYSDDKVAKSSVEDFKRSHCMGLVDKGLIDLENLYDYSTETGRAQACKNYSDTLAYPKDSWAARVRMKLDDDAARNNLQYNVLDEKTRHVVLEEMETDLDFADAVASIPETGSNIER